MPILPLWLAPTQVRVVPISDKFVTEAEKIVDSLEKNCVRADVDDRPLTMQKKVREAETEWINYVLVIGQREIDSGVLPVRDRRLRKIREMKLQELITEVRKEAEGKPFLPLTLPKLLSKRPLF